MGRRRLFAPIPLGQCLLFLKLHRLTILTNRRMKTLLSGILLSAALLFAGAATAQSVNPKPRTVPAVRYYKGAVGKLPLKNVQLDFSGAKTAGLDKLDSVFTQELKSLGVQISPSGVRIGLSATLPDSLKNTPSAYQVVVGKDVELHADSYEGFLYATRTLLQMLAQDKICLLYTSPSPRDCS